jgi:microcystin-dependent protein
MSEPYLADIRIYGFNFAPRGYATCDGQILPIAQNQSLYSLLGTTYGGDGRTTFALPDLRGRVPIHVGSSGGANYQMGQKGGAETDTLSVAQMPAHDHAHQPVCSSLPGNQSSPANHVMATEAAGVTATYSSETPDSSMQSAILASAGGGQSHDNMQPYLALNFAIALQGAFPSRN